jgi:DNA repair exonuclease SbcCD ATPase subunit
MRRQLKAVRTRAENLDDLKRQLRTIYRKTEETERQWKNMDPEHKHFASRTEALNSYRQAAREMNSKIKLEEAALADYKRTSTKMWMGLKFGGLVECCEKGEVRIFSFLLAFHFPP